VVLHRLAAEPVDPVLKGGGLADGALDAGDKLGHEVVMHGLDDAGVKGLVGGDAVAPLQNGLFKGLPQPEDVAQLLAGGPAAGQGHAPGLHHQPQFEELLQHRLLGEQLHQAEIRLFRELLGHKGPHAPPHHQHPVGREDADSLPQGAPAHAVLAGQIVLVGELVAGPVAHALLEVAEKLFCHLLRKTSLVSRRHLSIASPKSSYPQLFFNYTQNREKKQEFPQLLFALSKRTGRFYGKQRNAQTLLTNRPSLCILMLDR